MTTPPVFHLAFPVDDLDAAERYYRALGCSMGRRNEHALTIDFFGHQVVAHLVPEVDVQRGIYPRHFGLLVDLATLDELTDRVASQRLGPGSRRCRFAGADIEHETLVLRDPSSNVLEFKAYVHEANASMPSDDRRIGDT